MMVKILIQGTAKVVMTTLLSTGLMMTTAEAQTPGGQESETELPADLPGASRGISSTEGVQVVQPAVVTAPDSSDATGKKLKDVIPSKESPADQRAPLVGKGGKTGAPSSQAESPMDARTAVHVKTPKAAVPEKQAESPIEARTAVHVKTPKAAVPEKQAESPMDARTAVHVKTPKAAVPEKQAESPIDARTAVQVKTPKAAAPEAQAESPMDVRTAVHVKTPKAAVVPEAQAESPMDARTAVHVKTPKAEVVSDAPAESPVETRTAVHVKKPKAAAVDTQPESPIDARTAHITGKGGKNGKVAAFRAQRVSHQQKAADPLSCSNRQESGSVGGLMAFNQNWKEYDIEEENFYKEESGSPYKPEQSEKASATVGRTKFLKNLAKTMRQEVRRTRKGISNPTVGKRLCLQGVRMALQHAAGLPDRPWYLVKGVTLGAKDSGKFIEKELHYRKVPLGGQYNSRNVPFGAVLIYDDPRNSKAAGHIEIRGVDGYYSDFYSDHPIDRSGKRRLIGIYLPPEQ